jgi:hypothetical protein
VTNNPVASSVTGEPENVERILMADNLTGVCDTGGQFIRSGLSCRVELNLSNCRPLAMTDALALDTNSDERGRNLTVYLLAPIVLCALAPGLRKVDLTA